MNLFLLKSFIISLGITGVMVFQPFGLKSECLGMGSHKAPTAVVVDADTGKPIEGAVAIAIWREHTTKETAWFEGGKMVPVRIEEVISDKDGKIYIEGFWGWFVFENRYPRLNVYKPGYILWDQQSIYIDEHKSEKRTDFGKENNIVQLKKRPEEFSFEGHRRFMDWCTYGDISEAPKKLFRKAFDYERPYQIKENTERNKKRKEMEKKK
jgi:hypothetical protein